MIGLGERIKAAADQVGGLDRLATLLTDVSRRTLSDWANDKTEPRASALAEIAAVTDTSIIWLLNGGVATFPPTEEGGQPRVVDSRPPLARPNFAYLPFYEETCASAGVGSSVFTEAANSVIAFDRQFLHDSGASPQNCTVIRAKGDSMTPTIPDGSMLIVDHSQREIANGCIMVIGVGDDLLVKRIRRRLDGLIDLISDNQAYAPETLGPDTLQHLRVIGRVVYFCRTP